MKGKVYLSMVMIGALMSLMLVACGEDQAAPMSTPAEPTPTAPTPAATATLSAGDHVNLGMEHVEQGRLDEAILEFREAIRLDPGDADAHLKLGTALYSQGQPEAAMAEYREAIRLDPDYATAHNNLGLAYADQGRLDEAIAQYQEAIQLDPDYAMAHNNLGLAYANQGRFDEAMAQYQEAIRLDPDYATAHSNLGLLYANQGWFDEAIAQYQEAIRIDPDHVGAHVDLGMAYVELGQLDEAVAEWETAVKIDPTYALAHKNLGLAYSQQGRTEEAIAELQTYLELHPDAADRAAVEQDIAHLAGKDAKTEVEYRNLGGGYSLLYPESWYRAEEGTKVTLAPSREDYLASTLRAPLVTLISWPLAEAIDSLGLDETASPVAFLEKMAARLGSETGEVTSGQIVGYPAAVAATSGTFGSSPYRGDLVIILLGERLFLAEALAPAGQWEDFRPTFGDMVNSLSFFEP